ncbi:MAG: Rer1 family protein [Ignavibacteriales bacterium]|nr:Rer1 family protein [Ignavibacteriales bacterium]
MSVFREKFDPALAVSSERGTSLPRGRRSDFPFMRRLAGADL